MGVPYKRSLCCLKCKALSWASSPVPCGVFYTTEVGPGTPWCFAGWPACAGSRSMFDRTFERALAMFCTECEIACEQPLGSVPMSSPHFPSGALRSDRCLCYGVVLAWHLVVGCKTSRRTFSTWNFFRSTGIFFSFDFARIRLQNSGTRPEADTRPHNDDDSVRMFTQRVN